MQGHERQTQRESLVGNSEREASYHHKQASNMDVARDNRAADQKVGTGMRRRNAELVADDAGSGGSRSIEEDLAQAPLERHSMDMGVPRYLDVDAMDGYEFGDNG